MSTLMTSPSASAVIAPQDPDAQAPGCGGATILDLALCLILAVTVISLLLLAF